MYTHQEREQFMWAAIAQGRKALPDCLPNPPVGCVLVADHQIIASGYTRAPGSAHAEAVALAQLADEQDEFSAFVTLEPCSFYGRTPSCAKALIDHRVKQVYVGIIDPHPKNNGAGIALLQNAGIAVHIGLLAEQIKAELAPYLH